MIKSVIFKKNYELSLEKENRNAGELRLTNPTHIPEKKNLGKCLRYSRKVCKLTSEKA
jgi:hypothetical protein